MELKICFNRLIYLLLKYNNFLSVRKLTFILSKICQKVQGLSYNIPNVSGVNLSVFITVINMSYVNHSIADCR